MQSTLYGVSALDAWVIGAVAVTLLIAALLASCLPARNAAKTDPLIALRAD